MGAGGREQGPLAGTRLDRDPRRSGARAAHAQALGVGPAADERPLAGGQRVERLRDRPPRRCLRARVRIAHVRREVERRPGRHRQRSRQRAALARRWWWRRWRWRWRWWRRWRRWRWRWRWRWRRWRWRWWRW